MAILSALFGMATTVSPAVAQPPASNPNEMCGTGETFTVNLPGTSLGINDTDGLWRNITVPDEADADTITLPKGCRIYAFLISGFGDNADYDRIIFYKFAEFVAHNNGYVHVGWWNNLTAQYMQEPLHPETITIQKTFLGIPIGDPVNIFPTPKTEGIPDTFVNTTLDLPKANPDEDFQFVSDTTMVLRAVREHNPNAIIVLAGHSMGGNASARVGATWGVPIDLLALIDPVGNRDMPRGQVGQSNLNWTRWRAANIFHGYKQWDCVRETPTSLFCKDTDPTWRIGFTCTTSTTAWEDVKPLQGSLAPIACPRSAYVDPGSRVMIGNNVRYFYHRWQKEFLWPVDFIGTSLFDRPRGMTVSTTDILSGNYQAPVLPHLNPLVPNDPNKTCSVGTDPRDASFECNATDGHGEIIGVRVVGSTTRVRPGLQLNNWPPRSLITFTPGDRRDRLIQLAVDGPAWPYRPDNPDLCLVCDDLITITQHLMSQQPQETEDDTVAPSSQATQEPGANDAGWVNEDVVVSIDAIDDQSGVEEINVTLSGAHVANIVTPGSSAQTTVSAEGVTTVSYFARDEAGNSEAASTLDVRIDKTPPGIEALTDIPANGSGWNRSPVVVSFPASDNAGGSGLLASSPDVTIGTEGAAQAITGEAEDIAGNVSTTSVTLNIDLTPPDIALESRTPAANAAGWNNSDVTLTWTCADALSGPALAQVSRVAGTEGAAQNTTGQCLDRADNSASDAQSVNIDKTAPSVTITAPANGAVLLLNAQAPSNYACSDTLSGLNSCNGPVASGSAADTSSVGTKQFTVNAGDVADNAASRTHLYSVRYAFSGFANPIAPMPMRNVVNAGRTVPVKYMLQDASGALITNVATFVSLASVTAACDTAAPGVAAEETNAAGSTEIRWDAATQQFIYNWKTDQAWENTCSLLQLTLNDGTTHVAMFQFQ